MPAAVDHVLGELAGQERAMTEPARQRVVLVQLRHGDDRRRAVQQVAPALHVVEALGLRPVGVQRHAQMLGHQRDPAALVHAGQVGKHGRQRPDRCAESLLVSGSGECGHGRRIDAPRQRHAVVPGQAAPDRLIEQLGETLLGLGGGEAAGLHELLRFPVAVGAAATAAIVRQHGGGRHPLDTLDGTVGVGPSALPVEDALDGVQIGLARDAGAGQNLFRFAREMDRTAVLAVVHRAKTDLVAEAPDPLAVGDGGGELPAQPCRCALTPHAERLLDDVGRRLAGGMLARAPPAAGAGRRRCRACPRTPQPDRSRSIWSRRRPHPPGIPPAPPRRVPAPAGGRRDAARRSSIWRTRSGSAGPVLLSRAARDPILPQCSDGSASVQSTMRCPITRHDEG